MSDSSADSYPDLKASARYPPPLVPSCTSVPGSVARRDAPSQGAARDLNRFSRSHALDASPPCPSMTDAKKYPPGKPESRTAHASSMYSRGPVASAAPHLYEYFCLPEPAPPAAAPMSSFIVLATSMLGMAGAPPFDDDDDDWAPAEPDPAATAAGLGMPGNCFFLLLAPATPPAMVCLGIAGLLLPGAEAAAAAAFAGAGGRSADGSSFPPLLCAPAMKDSPTTPRPTPMNWPIDSIMPASSPLAARVDVWRRPARKGRAT
mmetsp:Transcript_13910/g.55142  ORF Transcript_13910/g.55142 Transcript_13910/m.55142 type:complete len:262 (+) Transcript_13910:777-1562(+)